MKEISIIGMGLGHMQHLSLAATEALRKAQLIIGSDRLLQSLSAFTARKEKAIQAQAIADIVTASRENNIAVVFSGDIGFYSGAEKLYALLEEYAVQTYNGTSSLQYMAAQLHRSWQNVHVVSGHGRVCDPVAEVLNHNTTFFLTDAHCTPAYICTQLCEHGLQDVQVHIGENLALPDEKVSSGTASALTKGKYAALNCVWIDNPTPLVIPTPHQGMPDALFTRGDVPMTKSVVRGAVLSKLGLQPTAIAYDIGAGTGSVAVEMALAAPQGSVYAIEHNAEACALVVANRSHFGVHNLHIVEGTAPDALRDLPTPDAAFIGGSGKYMREIIATLLAKNSNVRLVVTAITLETLSETLATLQDYHVPNCDVIQIAVTETRIAGAYRMLQAQNPVFIISAGDCQTA